MILKKLQFILNELVLEIQRIFFLSRFFHPFLVTDGSIISQKKNIFLKPVLDFFLQSKFIQAWDF